MLDGLKNIAARIPSPQQTKPEAAVEVAAAGVVVDALTDQTVWCLMPPYSPQHAFISLWGFGQCTEMGGTVTFTAGMEDAQRDIAETAERHGIWGISNSLNKRDKKNLRTKITYQTPQRVSGTKQQTSLRWSSEAEDMGCRMHRRGYCNN